MATVNVRLETPLLKTFVEQIGNLLDRGAPETVAVYKQWAARYRSFVQERFDTFSRGGGDWAPLAESTKKRRRRNKDSFTILRDTNTLFTALAPVFTGSPGALNEDIPFGVAVGYGGPTAHPSGNVSVADIASFHQAGGPNLPKREIIVMPPEHVVDAMAKDMQRGINKLVKRLGG